MMLLLLGRLAPTAAVSGESVPLTAPLPLERGEEQEPTTVEAAIRMVLGQIEFPE